MDKNIDLSLLANVSQDKFEEFSTSLIKEMCGYIPEPWNEIASSLNWSEEESQSLKEDFIKVIIEATYFPDVERNDYLRTHLDVEKSDWLGRSIMSKKLPIAKALMKQHNASIKPTLDNFDWKVKWILGNSSSTVMKYPIVGLELAILSAYKQHSDSVYLELDKNELDTLIEVLEQQI